MTTKVIKGFIKNWAQDETLLPITRAELVLDKFGKIALNSGEFEAGNNESEFGLISAADLAKIKNTSGGMSLSDIYNKLGYINTGIYVNNTPITFYNPTDGNKTPINITSSTVDLGVSSNAVTINLPEIITSTTADKLIKSLSVDSYGRITAISYGDLTNGEIPTDLSDKILEGCVTKYDEIGDNDRAIANKRYVDQAVALVNKVATGALVFGTSLKDADAANNALKSKAYDNHYFIATGTFDLNTGDLFDPTGYTADTTFQVKPGDTLIVYRGSSDIPKFIHVPSGDEKTTTITVQNDKDIDAPIKNKLGDVRLTFSNVFSLSNPNGNNIVINLPQVDANRDGYLSSADFVKFNSYAENSGVSYTGEFTNTTGYKIGTITVGQTKHDVYGKNQISKLELVSKAEEDYTPILQFTETGASPVSIEVKGIRGIAVVKNNNSIEISSSIAVQSDSQKYLEITDDYKLGVKLGSVVSNEVKEGLTDYREFAEFRDVVYNYGTIWNEVKELSYGSQSLIESITF